MSEDPLFFTVAPDREVMISIEDVSYSELAGFLVDLSQADNASYIAS